jgi:hypothetical protein
MSQGEEDERYYQVAAVFKKFGQPNAQFPKDLDLGALQDLQWRGQPSESSHSPFFFIVQSTPSFRSTSPPWAASALFSRT